MMDKGLWILSDDGYWLTCPFCDVKIDVSVGILMYVDNEEVEHIDFCPNCGKRMFKEDEDGTNIRMANEEN